MMQCCWKFLPLLNCHMMAAGCNLKITSTILCGSDPWSDYQWVLSHLPIGQPCLKALPRDHTASWLQPQLLLPDDGGASALLQAPPGWQNLLLYKCQNPTLQSKIIEVVNRFFELLHLGWKFTTRVSTAPFSSRSSWQWLTLRLQHREPSGVVRFEGKTYHLHLLCVCWAAGVYAAPVSKEQRW